MKRLKGFCEGVTVCLCVGFCLWMQAEYRPRDVGYSKEMTARMDELVKGITPLHTTDLGELE